MYPYPDDARARALHAYVRQVSAALGLSGEQFCVDPPATAYIALDSRLPHWPDREVALLWDQHYGWSLAVETHSGEDLLVHAHYDTALTPPAAEVAAWTAAVLAGPDRVPLARVGVARRLSHAAGTSL
ncbi:DUF6292 family protein [Saccharothrix sp. NPDC042600]|uniref:DUF6292 family protein n=1 Tax=Saccharothrix TaxID=2071 RepID=UPI0033F16F5B